MGAELSTAIDTRITELERQIACVKIEASFTNSNLDASRREAEELKQQLSSCEKVQQEMEMKLQNMTLLLSTFFPEYPNTE